VYVIGGVIGFVVEQDTVFALHILLIEVLCVAYGVHTMHIGQVDEYVRIGTDHYEFAIWMIGLDGLRNGRGSYVFANATLQVEYAVFFFYGICHGHVLTLSKMVRPLLLVL
jgi:hypothetical protein